MPISDNDSRVSRCRKKSIDREKMRNCLSFTCHKSDKHSMALNREEITEGLYSVDLWDRLDFHLASYVKTPLQLHFVSSKTALIGRALRHAIVDLLDHISTNPAEHVENDITVIGTEHRLFHSGQYKVKINDEANQFAEIKDDDDKIRLDISSLAPTVFHQLREDIGISNEEFRRSFFAAPLKDFTNPGKSGSLMYKTHDDLFILKTLREYEARLLMQILSGYHLQLTQRASLFNRYIGLYCIRLPTAISTIELYLVVMVNAFTPSLGINEVFDLKGSKIKRKLVENLCMENLYKLKDMDFKALYPAGIRLPSPIYQRMRQVVANDAKVLKKLNITDFSLILGIRHLDTSELELMQRRPGAGVSALLHLSHSIAASHIARPSLQQVQSVNSADDTSTQPLSYLRPLQMLDQPPADLETYYECDRVAQVTLPIPGIINATNQRVYLYLAIVDMLQTYDSFKFLDQAFRKLTDHTRHLQYSVIEPDDYEKRINQFLFEEVFVDAQDDFPWAITDLSKPVADLQAPAKTSKAQRKKSHSIVEFRL